MFRTYLNVKKGSVLGWKGDTFQNQGVFIDDVLILTYLVSINDIGSLIILPQNTFSK